MQVKTKFDWAHALGETEHFTEVKDRKVPLNAEFVFDFSLTAVKLQLAERAGVDDGFCTGVGHVDQFFVGDVKGVSDVVTADTSAGTAALHFVPVFDGFGAKGFNEFFEPRRVFGVTDDVAGELTVFSGFEKVTAVVAGNFDAG